MTHLVFFENPAAAAMPASVTRWKQPVIRWSGAIC